MALSFLERVQLQRAEEEVSRRFKDIPPERSGNPNLLFRVRRANPFPKQLKLVTVKDTWRDRGHPQQTRRQQTNRSSPQLPLFGETAAAG